LKNSLGVTKFNDIDFVLATPWRGPTVYRVDDVGPCHGMAERKAMLLSSAKSSDFVENTKY
jgi:hypothetical protein